MTNERLNRLGLTIEYHVCEGISSLSNNAIPLSYQLAMHNAHRQKIR
ncbi:MULTISPECIES: hypothetical protein [Vibrio]|nr:hypothetical protein [Vibrio sp. V43_P6S15P86]